MKDEGLAESIEVGKPDASADDENLLTIEEEEVLDFFEDDLTRALLWADVSRHSITTRASVKSDERPVEKSDDGVNDSYSDAGQDSIRRSYAEVKSNLSEDSD